MANKTPNYRISHDDKDSVWTVSVLRGRWQLVGAFNTWQEARDYIGECLEYDTEVIVGKRRYVFNRDHYGM